MTLDGETMARCLNPENFGNVVSCNLHYLSVAWESGYGRSSYVRLLNESGQIHCTLLIEKSRDAPLSLSQSQVSN